MSPTSCQTAPPRARRDRNYSEPPEAVSTKVDTESTRTALEPLCGSSLIGRRAACANHPRPLRRFGANPARELLGRARDDVETLFSEALPHFGHAHRALRLLVQSSDARGGRPRRREKPDPRERLELWHAKLRDARHLSGKRAALERGHRERLYAAGAHVRQHAGNDCEHGLDVAGELVGNRRRKAAVGYMDDEELRFALQKLHGEMRGAPAADRSIRELPGMRTRIGDEALEVADIELRHHDQHLRRRSEERDRREILVRVVGQILVEMLCRRDRPINAHEQRVAVGRRLGRGLGADVAARAAAVIDDEGLAERLVQPGGERAADDVGSRSWRKRDDHAYGFRRIGLSGREQRREQEKRHNAFHQILSVSPARGCHTRRRRSASDTPQSRSSANAVSTRMPAKTELMSNVPSACRMRSLTPRAEPRYSPTTAP